MAHRLLLGGSAVMHVWMRCKVADGRDCVVCLGCGRYLLNEWAGGKADFTEMGGERISLLYWLIFHQGLSCVLGENWEDGKSHLCA